MSRLLDFLFNSIANIWLFIANLGGKKQLPVSICVEPNNDLLNEYSQYNNEPPVESVKIDNDSNALLTKIVQIKRELKGELLPDEKTSKIIACIFEHNIPALFRENFHNGQMELYIHCHNVKNPKNVSDEDFGKAIPYCISKLKELGVSARTSSNMLIIDRENLINLATKYDILSDDKAEPKMNSVGIYR